MKYEHLVTISEEELKLYIHRVYSDGRKELFTSVDLPQIDIGNDQESFHEFAMRLGENILVDSPVARKSFRI